VFYHSSSESRGGEGLGRDLRLTFRYQFSRVGRRPPSRAWRASAGISSESRLHDDPPSCRLGSRSPTSMFTVRIRAERIPWSPRLVGIRSRLELMDSLRGAAVAVPALHMGRPGFCRRVFSKDIATQSTLVPKLGPRSCAGCVIGPSRNVSGVKRAIIDFLGACGRRCRCPSPAAR